MFAFHGCSLWPETDFVFRCTWCNLSLQQSHSLLFTACCNKVNFDKGINYTEIILNLRSEIDRTVCLVHYVIRDCDATEEEIEAPRSGVISED